MVEERKPRQYVFASLLVMLAAIVIPVVVAWRDAIENDYDSPPGWLNYFFLVSLAVLVAIFTPAVRTAVRQSRDVYALGAATVIIVCCLASAFLFAGFLDEPGKVFSDVPHVVGFMTGGFAAAVGARAAKNEPPWV
jgi:hypothetical protein